MANRRFIDFPIAASVGDNDIVLIWQDGMNKQTTKGTLIQGAPTSLEGLTDVDIAGLINGQILQYNSTTGKWENVDRTDINLSELNDVSIVSPTNGQVLVYNSSTSKWENSSGGFVPYTGAVTTVDLGAQGLRAGYIRFDTSVVSVPDEQGLVYWDQSRSTAALIMNGVLQHIGQDVFYYVKNSTGSSIAKGTAVRFDGTDGASGHVKIAPFLANGTYPSNYFVGVTAETIANGAFGQVMHFGELDGINTSGFTAGALLYASTTVAGGFQTTAPVAPNNIVLIAAAINSKNNGTILVRPTYGSNINQDEGVKITTPTTGDLLQLQAGGLWENKAVATVMSNYVTLDTGQTITGQKFFANNTLTLNTTGNANNTILTNSSGASTYQSGRNFFGFNTDNHIYFAKSSNTGVNTGILAWTNTATRTYTLPDASGTIALVGGAGVGTVTSVAALTLGTSGTDLNSTVANSTTTPVITLNVPTASATNRGALSAADWTTFNNKQNALTNPVTGTGTTNYLAKFTGTSTIGNSLVFDNGTNVGINTTNPLLNLQINSASGSNSTLAFSENNGLKWYTRYNAGDGSYSIVDVVNSATRLIISTGGNLGLGVTPSAWGVGQRAFDFGTIGSIETDGDAVAMSNNRYFDGGANRYKINDFASIFVQVNGQHIWYNAPSGTAGNAISFTQAMTLTSGGNLLVGTTTDAGFRLQVHGADGTSYLKLTSTVATTGGRIGYNGDELRIDQQQNADLTLRTNGSERMRITSGGNVGIGTSSPGSILDIRSANVPRITLVKNGIVSWFIGNPSQGTSNDFSIGTDAGGNTQILNITSTGNVGIGTTAPGAILHTLKSGTAISGVGDEVFIGQRSASTSNASITIVSSGESIIRLTNSANIELGKILYDTVSNFMRFDTNSTERLRITSGGNVLIGTTTNGASKLRISGLPTSSSGLSSGDIWNDSGTLKIA
jgi:urease beta subunit